MKSCCHADGILDFIYSVFIRSFLELTTVTLTATLAATATSHAPQPSELDLEHCERWTRIFGYVRQSA